MILMSKIFSVFVLFFFPQNVNLRFISRIFEELEAGKVAGRIVIRF